MQSTAQPPPAGTRSAALSASEVIESHYERIYSFLRRLAGNDPDAADLTQKTFSRVCQKLGGFTGASSVSSWIHAIAYHAFIDWRRSNGHTEERAPEWWAVQPASEDSPDQVVQRSDEAAAVYALVDTLEPELRDTLHLHFYQDLTLQETAEVMNVALSTVKYRKQQALAQLQKSLVNPVRKSSRAT
jgi:RNA polymerase sigma-70 factor (ECF subfamily)